jgi:hypothetical protein
LSSSGNADADADAGAAVDVPAFEVLPEAQADAEGLGEELRRAIADIVVALHDDPCRGELMDDRWPDALDGCRKIRFDTSAWNGAPRYRFIYASDPREGAAATMLVLAVGRRYDALAYARAAGRLIKREAAKRTPGARRRGRS